MKKKEEKKMKRQRERIIISNNNICTVFMDLEKTYVKIARRVYGRHRKFRVGEGSSWRWGESSLRMKREVNYSRCTGEKGKI